MLGHGDRLTNSGYRAYLRIVRGRQKDVPSDSRRRLLPGPVGNKPSAGFTSLSPPSPPLALPSGTVAPPRRSAPAVLSQPSPGRRPHPSSAAQKSQAATNLFLKGGINRPPLRPASSTHAGGGAGGSCAPLGALRRALAGCTTGFNFASAGCARALNAPA